MTRSTRRQERRAPRRRRARLQHDRAFNFKPRPVIFRLDAAIDRPTQRLSTMSNDSTFTILSTNAALVEVSGDGPISDVPGGLAIPDGAATTAPVDLLNAPVRRWRVDAPPTVQTAVVVTDSPYGVFVGVRRCSPPPAKRSRQQSLATQVLMGINRIVVADGRLRAFFKRRAPSLLALWYLFCDDVQPCTWGDVGDGASNQAQARGGDLVVVTFVSL